MPEVRPQTSPEPQAETRQDPVAPADNEARALARSLIAEARFGALGVIDPQTGFPAVTRIALGLGPDGGLYTLVSHLSAHSRALLADPRVSLLVGEPGPKGDPLTHPRLSLQAQAVPLPPESAPEAPLQAHWLAHHPKAKLYITLPGFFFVRFECLAGALNGGFARAYRLTREDLA